MAVYTEVAPEEAAALMADLGLGRQLAMRGIGSGIENTNYFVSTDQGEWVLTLFERLAHAELPYYLRLMRHLAAHGLPVPWPQGHSEAQLVHTVAGKPAAVVTRLAGSSVHQAGLTHCVQIGSWLGQMHRCGQQFPFEQPHGRGLSWWQRTAPEVLTYLSPDLARLVQDELRFQVAAFESAPGRALPRGHIHADLFRDNAMFQDTAAGPRLSGVLDFYFAGVDVWLFDLAVCLNDWCVDDDSGAILDERATALVSAYNQERPLTPGERSMLPTLLRAAAFRFWLSRLRDWHLPREATLLTPKDPGHFERVLRQRMDNPWSLPQL